VWYAFRVLSASRSIGYASPNPIQIESIFVIADHLGMDRDDLLFFIQGLDQTYLDEIQKKQEAERKRTAMKKPGKR
jgi:hypothetical protein